MRLQIYITKRYLTNKSFLFWGLLFMIFWAVIGAFIMGSSLHRSLPPEAFQLYTASWFGILALLSFSSMGATAMYSLSYHTGAIPYLRRYSRMRASDYISGIVMAGVVTSVIYGLVLAAVVYGLYSYHFGAQLPPRDLPLIVAASVAAGFFFVSLSAFIKLLQLKYVGLSPASEQAVNFIPLILGYGFGFAGLYMNLGHLAVYASPFVDLEYLLVEGYYGRTLHVAALVAFPLSTSGQPFSIWLGMLSLAAWAAALFGFSVYLFDMMYFRDIYEAKLF